MAKVKSWTPEEWKANLAKRLSQAKKYRERFEDQWRKNETTIYTHNSRRKYNALVVGDDLITTGDTDVENGSDDITEMAVNYAWKFVRFIHSQMSANPPSVVARPTSSDPSDRNAADAADRVCRHAAYDKDMQEIFDLANLKALSYGTSFVKTVWDPEAGDTFDFDEETEELTMGGDIRVYAPSTWDVWLDPDAKVWRDVRYVYERIEMPVEEACFKWPEHKEDISRFLKKKQTESELDDWREREEVVEVFAYVEKALPINGMAGRMAYCLEDGCLLGQPTKNTNPDEGLGFAIMTDIDVPDQVYGKSFVEYIFKLQDLLNRLDTSFVENVAAHNVVRMVLSENGEVEDESLSNSSWDYVRVSGNNGNPPYFVQPPGLMPDAHRLRENLIAGIQELAGVNDSMMGQVKREMSGFSIQTAIDAGNQTRRRLFNKYTMCVRDVYRMYLGNVREYWSEPRTIMVLGKEKAFESSDLKGADIAGGYDIMCEYGASLSLDPARRREEIMQLLPIFEKAGVPTKTILSMLKLNELESMYDRMQMAADRQREIFDEMIATEDYIEPDEMQDHAGMLDYAYTFLMSAEFKYLADDQKDLLTRHVKEREQLAKTVAQQGQVGGAVPAPNAPLPPQPLPGTEPPAQTVPAA